MNEAPLYFVKIVLAIFVLVAYMSISVLIFVGLDKTTIITIARHVILVPGLVPVLSWIIFLISRNPIFDKTLFLLNLIITFFHIIVFAISAHKDGPIYWIVELVEVGGLWLIYRRIIYLKRA